jgi:hypothetical protein
VLATINVARYAIVHLLLQHASLSILSRLKSLFLPPASYLTTQSATICIDRRSRLAPAALGPKTTIRFGKT